MTDRAEWATDATKDRGTILERRGKYKFFTKAPASDPLLAGQPVPRGWGDIYAVNEAAKRRDAQDLREKFRNAGLLYEE